MNSESLIATEAECAKGRTAPRVSLADIEANIAYETTCSGLDCAADQVGNAGAPDEAIGPLGLLTIYLIVLKNGFTIIGKSAPSSADNFDAELGRKLAREDAIRQIWPLMGYALRDRLHHGEAA